MSDPKVNAPKLVETLIGSVFTTLEPFYQASAAAGDALTKADSNKAAKRRELADSCAKAALAGNWSEKEIAAGIKFAIANYKGNAIEKKTLQNIGGELKNVMHPKVRAELPELRKLTDTVFKASDPAATDVQSHFQGKKDFMVARMATAVVKGNNKMPKTLADMTKIVATRNVAKAESLPAAKRFIESIIEKTNEAYRVYQLSEFTKIKALCEALMKEDVLKDALDRAKAANKNAQAMRRAGARRTPNGTANGASDIVSDMTNAIN